MKEKQEEAGEASQRRRNFSPSRARRVVRKQAAFADEVDLWLVKAEGPDGGLTAAERRRLRVEATAMKGRNTSGRAGVIVGFAAVSAGILAVAQGAAKASGEQQATLLIVFIALLLVSVYAFADSMGVGSGEALAAEIAAGVLDRRAAREASADPAPTGA